MWYLIVSIPDLCNLTYFEIFFKIGYVCKIPYGGGEQDLFSSKSISVKVKKVKINMQAKTLTLHTLLGSWVVLKDQIISICFIKPSTYFVMI